MSSFKLTSKQVSKPSFKKRCDSSHKKHPNSPSRSPESTSRTLANRSSIESVVDDMFEIFTHTNLSHQLIFVTIHSSKLAHMCKYVLQTICQLHTSLLIAFLSSRYWLLGYLEGINISKTILNVTVDD